MIPNLKPLFLVITKWLVNTVAKPVLSIRLRIFHSSCIKTKTLHEDLKEKISFLSETALSSNSKDVYPPQYSLKSKHVLKLYSKVLVKIFDVI